MLLPSGYDRLIGRATVPDNANNYDDDNSERMCVVGWRLF